MTDRRQFLQIAAGTAGLVGLTAAGCFSRANAADQDRVEPAAKPLSILFLGGTGFIGPHQVEHALARGHQVTTFNRGRKSGYYGDRVEELTGNRDAKVDEGLAALQGDRTWDVVIDNSGYVPRHVRDSVQLLKDRCRRYVYVSTV
ncbi:MAG: epimerase, partial [Candidatus Krumholzibacteriia bacterium]